MTRSLGLRRDTRGQLAAAKLAMQQGDLALAHSVYHEGADTAAGRVMNQVLLLLGAPGGTRDQTSCNGPCPTVNGPQPNPA